MKSTCEQISQYATKLKYEDVPEWVRNETKRVLLDSLACAIGGYESLPSKIVQRLGEECPGVPEATIVGSGVRTSCISATLANGVMLRYWDYNDTFVVPVGDASGETSGCHPSEIIPMAIAVGERQHINGKDLITAIALGYDLIGKFTASVTIPLANLGWHPTGTIGQYVTSVVAGKILGLDESQMTNAIGISGCHNVTLGVVDAEGEEYSMTKNIVFPFAAQSGIQAAILAQNGFTGPIRVIEGKNGFLHSVMSGQFDLQGLSESDQFGIFRQLIRKLFPAESSTQSILTAILKLVRDHDIKPEDIKLVKIRTGQRCVRHTGDPAKRYPRNKETADHSTPYLVAVGIMDREISLGQFSPGKFTNAIVRNLINKVEMEPDPELDRQIPAAVAEITTTDERKFMLRVDYHKGHFRNPMTDKELQDKFRSIASKYIGEDQIAQIIRRLGDLENLGNICQLTELLSF